MKWVNENFEKCKVTEQLKPIRKTIGNHINAEKAQQKNTVCL